MAVVIEGFTIVLRNSTLDEKYPGGLDSFVADCPNATYCTDGSLSRVAFMHSSDAEAFIDGLIKKGFLATVDGQAIDVALISPIQFLHARGCSWLVFATFKGVPVTWLDGVNPTPIVGPPGYVLGREMTYITAEEASKRLIHLRTENGVEVYRDITTGKEVYIGRAASN